MQYHHQGYVARDPRVKDAAGTGVDRVEELPDEMDVLIVGAGPSGIVQAAQLTNYPSIHTRIIDMRPGRLAAGRADGLFPRSGETFQAFEFYDTIAAEASHMREMSFWAPNPADPTQIARGARAADPPSSVSEFPILRLPYPKWYSVRQGRLDPAHPARGRLPDPLLCLPRQPE